MPRRELCPGETQVAAEQEDTRTESVDPLHHVVGESFAPVYRAEIDAIAARRRALGVAPADDTLRLPDISWSSEYQPSPTLTQVFEDLKDSSARWRAETSIYGVPSGLIGLALSGGGIRSSTFNLGVLQAIDRTGLFPYVDYLSTVSGGGFIGTYLTTSIIEKGRPSEARSGADPDEISSQPVESFPFKHETGKEESSRFRHLRNHSEFLAPGGKSELLSIPLILLRGFVINLIFLVPFLLAAGVVLGLAMLESPDYRYFTHEAIDAFLMGRFAYQPGSGLAVLFGFFPLSLAVAVVLLLSFVAFPIAHTLRTVRHRTPEERLTENSLRRRRSAWLKLLRITLTVGLVVLFLESQPVVLANTSNLIQWLTGLLGASVATAPFADKIFARLSEFQAWLGAIVFGILVIGVSWLALLFITKQFADGTWTAFPALIVAAVLLAFSLIFVDANATSIHNYYRDHLVQAFVAQAAADELPETRQNDQTDGSEEQQTVRGPTRAEKPVPRLSELDVDFAPYHLINATVNLEREKIEYRSGRKGSFFLFSPRYCGGIRTGYLPTRNLERVATTLDVGTAMAISGAALAPNMGRFGNRFVSFVLAVLNIRLNYWLHNPRKIIAAVPHPAGVIREGPLSVKEKWLQYRSVGPIYLLREMFQRLSVDGSHVNLSDGGHIENLGIYELMRRQCRLIVVGDGEADKGLTFQGLTEAIRLARIDFGYRVDMDGLDEIRSGDQQFAIGTIHYSEHRVGKLIYIKSNLGGDYNLQSTLDSDFYRSSADRDDDYLYDDNTYIAYYKNKNPDFPHESTADQFFDESQFESYRALGYNVAARALIKPWVPNFEEEA